MDTCTVEDLEQAAELFQKLEGRRDWTESILCILDVDSGEVTELQRFDTIIEAPNWSPDGSFLYYNADGLIYRYELSSKAITQVNTGPCTNCNNDHVLSSDGRKIAVSHMNIEGGFSSYIYRISLAAEDMGNREDMESRENREVREYKEYKEKEKEEEEEEEKPRARRRGIFGRFGRRHKDEDEEEDDKYDEDEDYREDEEEDDDDNSPAEDPDFDDPDHYQRTKNVLSSIRDGFVRIFSSGNDDN